MLFSSISFLYYFLPCVLLLYFAAPKRLKNSVLLLASLFFYGWGEPKYLVFMLVSIAQGYVFGLLIEKYRGMKRSKLFLTASVLFSLGLLGYCKYADFLIENFNAATGLSVPLLEIALPIGISFYTFQILSYAVDVYRGSVGAQKNFIRLALYIAMFPQLIAGPIVRYADIDAQLAKRNLSLYKFGQGVAWFLRGLGKKVLLANNIGMTFDAIAAIAPDDRSMLTAWIGCLAYAMQIYFDFSGYSDMAVGLGKMLGFEFVRNFNYPYISKSVTDFWRRWHISLSTWFREYVYIPLGGNRVSKLKHVRNILVVWMLTGFWHGAAWNFMMWGLYYGLLLLLEKYFLAPKLQKLPDIVQQIYSFLLVLIGWVLFFSASLPDALVYLGNMFGIGGHGIIDSTGLYYLTGNLILLVICFFCATPFVWKRFRRFALKPGNYPSITATVVYAAIFVLSIAYLVNATYNPFLYFRF